MREKETLRYKIGIEQFEERIFYRKNEIKKNKKYNTILHFLIFFLAISWLTGFLFFFFLILDFYLLYTENLNEIKI